MRCLWKNVVPQEHFWRVSSALKFARLKNFGSHFRNFIHAQSRLFLMLFLSRKDLRDQLLSLAQDATLCGNRWVMCAGPLKKVMMMTSHCMCSLSLCVWCEDKKLEHSCGGVGHCRTQLLLQTKWAILYIFPFSMERGTTGVKVVLCTITPGLAWEVTILCVLIHHIVSG